LLCSASLAAVPAFAGPASVAVDVPTRDATQRFQYTRAERPVANVVFVPGGEGVAGIDREGRITTIVGTCGPFARNREAFAARGLSIAVVDRSSDGRLRQFVDVLEVARYMRARDRVPTVIAGGSASTSAVLAFAATYPADDPLLLVVFGPMRPDLSAAARVKRPTLVIFHARDLPALPFAQSLVGALTAAPIVEKIMLDGGTNAGCGYHLFTGIDEAFVEAVTGFIARHARLR
jgi:hypothetical protein